MTNRQRLLALAIRATRLAIATGERVEYSHATHPTADDDDVLTALLWLASVSPRGDDLSAPSDIATLDACEKALDAHAAGYDLYD